MHRFIHRETRTRTHSPVAATRDAARQCRNARGARRSNELAPRFAIRCDHDRDIRHTASVPSADLSAFAALSLLRLRSRGAVARERSEPRADDRADLAGRREHLGQRQRRATKTRSRKTSSSAASSISQAPEGAQARGRGRGLGRHRRLRSRATSSRITTSSRTPTRSRSRSSDNRSLSAKVVGSDQGSDLAVLQGGRRGSRGHAARRLEQAARRRLRRRDRQPVRLLEHGDFGNRERARPQRHQPRRVRGLHPDRRVDQSGQLRRRARESQRRARRDQLGDHLAQRRQHRHRLRDPGEHGALDHGPADHARLREPRPARRQHPGRHARGRRDLRAARQLRRARRRGVAELGARSAPAFRSAT